MPWMALSTADIEAIRKSLAELEHDSDRAAGIVGAVLVEESLTALVQSKLILQSEPELTNEIFRSSGPLGAFSVKINVGFLMGLYTDVARKELDNIRLIRNEFAHRVARSFSSDRIRSLANNLNLSEKIEFHIETQTVDSGAPATAWMGGKPPADRQSIPLLGPIASEKLNPRERYIRACQFFSGALLFLAQQKEFPPAKFF